jgi:hypothetical protein
LGTVCDVFGKRSPVLPSRKDLSWTLHAFGSLVCTVLPELQALGTLLAPTA